MRAADLSAEIRRLMTPRLAKEFSGPSAGVFIGSENYPNVNVGPLGMLDNVVDDPAAWLGMNYQQIMAIRGSVIRSGRQENVRSTQKIVSNVQEIAAAGPTDIEMIFQKKPHFSMTFDRYVQPMGPFAKLESLRLQENPKIDVKVEKILNDEMKAGESALSLYFSDIDVYKITTILSSGALGLDRKMVPTRWSITATDDIITKQLLKEIRVFRTINEFLVFETRNLDNHFTVLMMPGSWEFENFESWFASGGIEQEYEPFEGRTAYADKEGGGYYASRIGVAECLHRMRRQARVVVFREIHEGYSVPLGVWQVRENVRKATRADPVKFSTKTEALSYISRRLRMPLTRYIEKSRIFRQRRLTDF